MINKRTIPGFIWLNGCKLFREKFNKELFQELNSEFMDFVVCENKKVEEEIRKRIQKRNNAGRIES